MIIIMIVVCSMFVAALFVAKTVIDDQSEQLASNEVKIAELLTELNAAHDKLTAIADLTKPYHD